MARPLLGGQDPYSALDSRPEYDEDGTELLPRDDPRSMAGREKCIRTTFVVLLLFAITFCGVAIGVPDWLQHSKEALEDPSEAPVDFHINVGIWRLCHQVANATDEQCLSLGRVCGERGDLVIMAPYDGAPGEEAAMLLSVSADDKDAFCSTVTAMRVMTILAILPAVVALLLLAMWRDAPGRVLAAFPSATALFLVVAVCLAPRMNDRLAGGRFAYGASFGVSIAATFFCAAAAACAVAVARTSKRSGMLAARVRLDDDAAL